MHFLKTFSEAQAFGEYVTPKYIQRANDLFGDQSRQSLTIDLKDLNQYSNQAANFLVKSPKLGLQLLNEALRMFLVDIQ